LQRFHGNNLTALPCESNFSFARPKAKNQNVLTQARPCVDSTHKKFNAPTELTFIPKMPDKPEGSNWQLG
jgi:hypothetical protein